MEGGLDPTYVMDEMLMYELEPLISNLHLKNKDSWEQARLIAYIVALVNSSKKMKPTDILTFTWDKEVLPDTSISNLDIERLRDQAKQYLIKK